jgi:alkylhydroperoxidase/carboxymuconolactone decarboxylase family protein YurZ
MRLGALIALGAGCTSYQWAVEAALAAGATVDDIVGTLIAVAPISGLARVILATPEVATALGYDIDRAFEAFGADPKE